VLCCGEMGLKEGKGSAVKILNASWPQMALVNSSCSRVGKIVSARGFQPCQDRTLQDFKLATSLQ
jgi:hypothetical protein